MKLIVLSICFFSIFFSSFSYADNCDIADNDFTLASGSNYNGTISGYCNVFIGNNSNVQNGGITADGFVVLGSNVTVSGNIIAEGDVTVGSNSIVQNNSITSGGNVVLEDGARVDQGITADGSVTIGQNATVQNGNVIAGENVTLNNGSRVNNNIVAGGNITIEAGTVQNGSVSSGGDVTLESGAIVNNSITADGVLTIKNGAKVQNGIVCGKSGVFLDDRNLVNNSVKTGDNCNEDWVRNLPDFSDVIFELTEQCADIFPDPLQGHNSSVELDLDGDVINLNAAELSFSQSVVGDGECFLTGNYPGGGEACGNTGIAQALSNSFTIPSDNGSVVEVKVKSGNSVTLGVAGANALNEGSNDNANGSYSNTFFKKIVVEDGGQLIFTSLSGSIYEIGQLEGKGSGAEITFSPAQYAIYQVTLEQVVDVTAIAGDPIYIFSENQKFNFDVKYTGADADLTIVSNGSVLIELTGGSDLTAKIYAAIEIDFNNVDGGNDTVNFYGALSAGGAANETTGMYIDKNIIIHNTEVCTVPPTPNVFTFTFDGTQTQALTCESHAVDIQARLNGAINDSYVNTINITTSTGIGDWSIVDTNNAKGTLDNGTAGDGIATYQFVDSDDGQIKLSLSHSTAGAVNVAVSNSDASENIDLTFSSAVLKTELSCIDESLGPCINTANLPFSMKMTAVKEDDLTSLCVNYNPTQIDFWSEYVTPSSPIGLAVEIDGNEIGSNESNALPLNVTFTNGEATVAVNYPDAGKIKIHAQDTNSNAIEGEAETIVNPFQLLIGNINASNGNNNPETTDSGNGFSRASVADYSALSVETFDITVTGLKDCSNDTKDHCSSTYGERTPSFESEIDLQTSLIFPTSGILGNLQYDGDDGYKVDLVSGLFTYENLAYDEVGSFGVTASTVGGYLVTNNDIETIVVQNVGRFYPDYLGFNSFTATPACVAGDFTYLGQIAIDVSYNMQAYAQGGSNITVNYDQSKGYPVPGEDGSTAFSDQTYDQTPLSLTTRLLPDDYYSSSDWIEGQYNVIAQKMGIAKDATVDGPYFSNNQVDYFIKLIGIDGEKVQIDSATTCSDDSCNIGDLGDLAYGRLQAGNGHGSEYQAIRTNIAATYYDGTRFIDFTRDACSTITMSQVSSDPTKNASNEIQIIDDITSTTSTTTLSIINSPLVDGKSQFNFSAPNNRGKLDYYIKTDSVAPWLLDSGNAVDCPSGVEDSKECISGAVEFGLFRGNDRIIYRLQTFD